MTPISHPLMDNNITAADREVLIDFLKGDPKLTNGPKVIEFERKWSEWLGVKHSLFVNSGSSANLLSMAALKILKGSGDVLVPAITWSSDISTILTNGHTPKFVDIQMNNLSMDIESTIAQMTDDTKAVFLTHILGFNGLNDKLLEACKERNIPLIEDVCESHGATYKGQRLGSLGWMSNFSFYYAHHMSTIEGGMVCTNDDELYELLRVLRSHGMVREATSEEFKQKYYTEYPDLNPQFIFAHPAYNVRSTEINAVIGLNQLPRLDKNNEKRVANFNTFLEHIDPEYFYTDFNTEGSVNYAFTLILKKADDALRAKLEQGMTESKIEFRRGTSGGGNQLRQPYVKNNVSGFDLADFGKSDHVHFYGYYIGNYPDLPKEKIIEICERLNTIVKT